MSHEELDIEAQLDRMLDEATESAASSAADQPAPASDELDDQAELLGDMETVEQVVASAKQVNPAAPAEADDSASDAEEVEEPEAAAAKSSVSDDDLADQIQKMLDAASEQAANPSAADIAADKADELPAEEQSPEQVIAQIDDQLADEADDDIVGDFESIQDVAEAHHAAAADPLTIPGDRAAHGDPPHDAEDDDEALAGDMQSVDQALSELDDSPDFEASDDAPDDAESAGGQADAAAVAAELDADEALHRRPRPAAGDHPDEQAVDRPSGAGDHDQALDRAASTRTPKPAEKAPQPARPAGPGVLIRLMAGLNRPLQSAPRSVRDFVGFFGLTLLFWAVCLFGAAFGGITTAVIAGAIALPGLLAAFYLLFIRQGPDIIHG